MELADRRRFYAEEVCAVAGLDDPVLVDAFASVPREHFLGPGPWSVVRMEGLPAPSPYKITADADPAHVYHNVLVAIDPERQLNNGHPSSLAFWISALQLRVGEHVVHVGSGVGYYTAVMAELVGASGSVTAIEVDVDLAGRARTNLAPWPWVEVATSDASMVPNRFDAMFVNAGCTHARDEWLDGLNVGGRLLLPLTARQSPRHSAGVLARIGRQGGRFSAEWISRVSIYDCAGAREQEESDAIEALMRSAGANGRLPDVKTFRRDPHEPGADCVLHTARYCVGTAAAGG